jgi:hypothetical protein
MYPETILPIVAHIPHAGTGVPDAVRDQFLHYPGELWREIAMVTDWYTDELFGLPGPAKRLRFGFIGSSDNHAARPGTGFKELNRREMTEALGLRKGWFNRPSQPEKPARHDEVDIALLDVTERAERDRINSFFTTGGLVAVHAQGRKRENIWAAVERKQVYGTSGDRILLWFDLVQGDKFLPMGSEVAMTSAPEFEVRAVGAFKQNPGCQEHSRLGLGPDRLYNLCRNECYNPSEDRKIIERLEVIKIRPQQSPNELPQHRIEDPWRVHQCTPYQLGCQFRFYEPDFEAEGRDALYYVRVIQEFSDAVNGANLRCEYNDQGECIKVNPCHGNARLTPYQDDCLAPVNELAWSSPIFVDYAPPLIRRTVTGRPSVGNDIGITE